MQGGELREMEWAPPTETAPLFFAWQDPPEEYGPWQWAGESGRAAGRFTAEAFSLQEDGKLRCPAGASLWLSEVRQENAYTQRAVYLAYQTDCLRCTLREQSLDPGAKGTRARRKSRSPSSLACACRGCAKTCQAWTNRLGGCGRASASPHLDGPLASAIRRGAPISSNPAGGKTSSSPPSCHPFSSPLERAGPIRPQCRLWTTALAC
jgi:hypothetical protein